MEPQVNVIFTGEIKPGADRESFIAAFSQRFKCDLTKAAEVHDAGKPVTMKRGVSHEVGNQMSQMLEAMGMSVRLEPVSAGEAPSAPPPAEPGTPAGANPYQAPKAELSQRREPGQMSGPVSVPFGHGVSWLSDAWGNHFKGNALPWIGAFLLMVIISAAIQMVPLLGMIVSSLLSPVFVGGLMLGARAQDDGEPFTVDYLFKGFKASSGQLMLVGFIYLIGTVVIMAVVVMMMGGTMGMMGGLESGDPAAVESMMEDPTMFMVGGLVAMLLFFPLLMAYWFAPVLIALDAVPALSAMKLSFSACLKNILPFTLYGLMLIVLMVVAMIPLGLGFLILLPVMLASMYTSYRDIFYPQA